MGRKLRSQTLRSDNMGDQLRTKQERRTEFFGTIGGKSRNLHQESCRFRFAKVFADHRVLEFVAETSFAQNARLPRHFSDMPTLGPLGSAKIANPPQQIQQRCHIRWDCRRSGRARWRIAHIHNKAQEHYCPVGGGYRCTAPLSSIPT